jgi:hypothetical protein
MNVLYYGETWSWNGDERILNLDHLVDCLILIKKNNSSQTIRIRDLDSNRLKEKAPQRLR